MSYEEDYHRTVHDYLHDDAIYERWAKIHRRRYFSRIQPQHAVFEFGCGLGQNLYGLPAQEKVGYDISAYAREFCAKKGLQVLDSIESLRLKSFDFVISRHSLEHLEDPVGNLRLLGSLIKPGGRLILVLPEERPYKVRRYEPDVDNHLFSWTPRTLANLLYHTGFVVESIRREPNSGLRFFSKISDLSYPLFRFGMRSTDLFRRVIGEWIAEAIRR